jgi:hypothetical protein
MSTYLRDRTLGLFLAYLGNMWVAPDLRGVNKVLPYALLAAGIFLALIYGIKLATSVVHGPRIPSGVEVNLAKDLVQRRVGFEAEYLRASGEFSGMRELTQKEISELWPLSEVFAQYLTGNKY